MSVITVPGHLAGRPSRNLVGDDILASAVLHGRFWELSWIGCDYDSETARQGVALYEPRGTVTVLSRDVIEAAA